MTKPSFQEIATAIFGGLLILVTVNLISEVGRTARWVTASPEERNVLILNDLSPEAREDWRCVKHTETERLFEQPGHKGSTRLTTFQEDSSISPVASTTKADTPSKSVSLTPIDFFLLILCGLFYLASVCVQLCRRWYELSWGKNHD